MTGIERLRELGSDYVEHAWSAAGKSRGMLIIDIADQIERETQPKGGPAAVSVSANDLLPQEDREAITWVKEHGGLDHVRSQWGYLKGRANHADHVDRKLEKRQRQIDESHAALRRRNGRIAELPVLAADGKPLRVGEKVWDTCGNRQFKVLDIDDDCRRAGYIVQTIGVDGMGLSGWSDPSKLTHERPEIDSWERLEEDAEGGAKGYCSERGLAVDGGAYGQAKAVDLVRRAKALVERGE